MLRDNHRYALRRGRFPRHVHQFAVRGLGKDRRRFAGGAKIDFVAGEGVQQLWPGREFAPQHADAEMGEGAFQALSGL